MKNCPNKKQLLHQTKVKYLPSQQQRTQENGNQLHEMYTAITENINYDYIYNYFFDPEKIKGITYKPANEEQLNARLTAYRNKNKASLNAADLPDTKK